MAESKKLQVNCLSYILYYMMLFFAYWFGASRFDVDGDGDFDPEDVQAWLADRGVLQKNYVRRSNSKNSMRSGNSERRSLSKNSVTSTSTDLRRGPSKDSVRSPASALGERQQSEVSEVEGSPETRSSDGPREENPPPPSSAVAPPAGVELHEGEDPEQQGQRKGGLASWLDRDGDGQLAFNDFVETKVSGAAQEDIAMQNIVSGQVRPWFIIFECSFCFAMWFISSLANGGSDFLTTKGGLDSIFESGTDLRFYGSECEDLRWQFWRWLTYQFTHVGVSHVLMNMFLNTMLGVPLEGAHGHWRMAIMFNVGVFGGACANMLFDGRTTVVGCSGGCYSLIGIHVADLLMNWHQKKFRMPTVVLILLLILTDILSNAVAASDNVSHLAHFGGASAGLLIGILTTKNLKMMAHERCFMITSGFMLFFLTVFSLSWLAAQTGGPLNIFESASGEDGWCWTQQVFNYSFPEHRSYCVKCGTEECVAHFKKVISRLPVELSKCEGIGWLNGGN